MSLDHGVDSLIIVNLDEEVVCRFGLSCRSDRYTEQYDEGDDEPREEIWRDMDRFERCY